MNSDETKSLITKILLMAFTTLSTSLHLSESSSSLAAGASDVADLAVLGYGIYAHWNMRKVPETAKVIGVAILLAMAFSFAPSARAADMPLKAPQAANPFAGYIAGRCGFYMDLNSMGGAGALSGTAVPGASVIQGDIGAGLGYGCPLGSAPGSFWFAQADFDFANINGAANGLSMTGPAHFEQRLAIGGPIANILSFFPSNPLSGLSTPSTPACPSNVTCGPQYAFLFASIHEQDVGMQLPMPVPGNRAWLAYPGLGLGLESRWSNGLVVDATIQWTMQSSALGIGTENVKFGNGALAGLVFKY